MAAPQAKEQKITVTKTTTPKTGKPEDDDGPYMRQVTPKTTIIHRTSYKEPSDKSKKVERTISHGVSMMGANSGAYSAVTTSGVNSVKQSRKQEKIDMQDLNDRFAGYIEKVRNLEAQNRKLADELDKLKQKWGKETTSIKALFEADLDEARKQLNDAEKAKARLEIKCASLEEQIEELRRALDEANFAIVANRDKLISQDQQIGDYEAEIALLRKRAETLEKEREKDRKEIERLKDLLAKARLDLDSETLDHVDAENRRQTLEEEIEFLKRVHAQEMKELASLAYRDTGVENRDFWKSELAQALREIQSTYDEKLDLMKGDLEGYYNMKTQEFRTGATRQNMEAVNTKEESKRLRNQVTDYRKKLSDLEAKNAQLERELDALRREYETKEREFESENALLKNEMASVRSEMEAILRELQELMDTKLGLELEIAAYRKLLEGEENRSGLRQVVENILAQQETKQPAKPADTIAKGEMSAKTTYQRSAKGPVGIAECSADGKFVCLENTGRKDEQLGGWLIKRNIDGADKQEYKFDPELAIKPNNKIKIWAKGTKASSAPATDLEATFDSWGLGATILTRLVNPTGEDRATHTQKTTYTS